jgi:hypothetical protein
MTNDEIINLAIENTIHGLKFDEEGLLRFAKLIAQHEREQNAKICQDLAKDMTKVGEFAAMLCAKLIRGQA